MHVMSAGGADKAEISLLVPFCRVHVTRTAIRDREVNYTREFRFHSE
jgi:hypothetical protein